MTEMGMVLFLTREVRDVSNMTFEQKVEGC